MLGKVLVLSVSLLPLIASNAAAQANDLAFIDQFKTVDPSQWEIAEYDFDHPHFDTDWRKANVVFGRGALNETSGLALSVVPNQGPNLSQNKFLGGSIRRKTPTLYGRYEALIKPAKGAGFVTGFFTYTGPYYGTQHDEIDIEFLGKDTSQIHIAWFKDGELTNKFIDLGFDAASKPHRYAFEWLPDRINWFVEDQLIFSIHASDIPLPNTPSMLFANVWAADHSVEAWSGKTKPNQTGNAWFGEVAFIPYRPDLNANTQDAITKIETTAAVGLGSHE